MDGKYARYIQNFMQSYKIKGDKIEIQTDANAKNQPLTYELNQSNVEKYDSKLGEEYEILASKKDEINKNETKNYKIFTLVSGTIFTIFLVLTSSLVIENALLALILKLITIASAALTTIGVITVGIKKTNFDKLINIFKGYKIHRKNIERIMQHDENVTKYLSEDTKALIEEKKEQVAKGYSSEILDMDFMDTLLDKKSKGRRELINLLNMYKAVVSLNEAPQYISPCQEKQNTPKKKSKKPAKKSTEKQ